MCVGHIVFSSIVHGHPIARAADRLKVLEAVRSRAVGAMRQVDLAERVLLSVPKDRTNDVIHFDAGDTEHPLKPDHKTVAGSGDSFDAALADAKKNGCDEPFLAHIPKTPRYFAGGIR